jgi:uncharacterized membrane protein YeaQ/YmgE (transglycosylase-associated protein family)
MAISIIAWIILGVVVGYIAGRMVNKRGQWTPIDLMRGVFGAVAGGWIYKKLGHAGIADATAWSVVAAMVGSAVVLGIWHAIGGPPFKRASVRSRMMR